MFSCGFFFKQKTAYEMRISDWSSDVCSSDLLAEPALGEFQPFGHARQVAAIMGLERIGIVARPFQVRHVLARPVFEVGEAEGGQIGRASCRERVCQYV